LHEGLFRDHDKGGKERSATRNGQLLAGSEGKEQKEQISSSPTVWYGAWDFSMASFSFCFFCQWQIM
jgi:hypothetical protein